MEAARHYTFFVSMGFSWTWDFHGHGIFMDREMLEVQQLNPQHGGSFRPTVLIVKPLSTRWLDGIKVKSQLEKESILI